MGVQLYYDSSKLTFTGTTQIYSQGSVGSIADLNDTTNGDSNASTDKRIPAGWFDLGSNWPNVVGNVVLFKATFTANGNFTADTTINVTGVPAVGHTIATTPVAVSAAPIPIPVNSQNIPTLSEWGIILLSLMLVFISWLGIGNKKQS